MILLAITGIIFHNILHLSCFTRRLILMNCQEYILNNILSPKIKLKCTT